ncbi:hypothetical protein O181_102436 [Austropuccinia psidii MF-1]|uniref:Uncharacterized protein n=1 Tax=Austropuccinia psidii MF-1 TaxID=1389203 RepID=A0A9Q3JIN5_9BASI|nr:hypothetical protein [Austropuccinia psidii MF-1]
MIKFFNVCQNINSQDQKIVPNTTYTPYHKEDRKPNSLMKYEHRSTSIYQDKYKMTNSEKEALRQLPQATICLEFSCVGEYDHMELIYYIYLPSIPDYRIAARMNKPFKEPSVIWYTEIK